MSFLKKFHPTDLEQKIKTCIQLRVIFSAKFDHSGTMADKIVSQTKLPTTPPFNQSVLISEVSKWKQHRHSINDIVSETYLMRKLSVHFVLMRLT